MPPGRHHVFASFVSLHLRRDAKDVERRTGRFPDVDGKNYCLAPTLDALLIVASAESLRHPECCHCIRSSQNLSSTLLLKCLSIVFSYSFIIFATKWKTY